MVKVYQVDRDKLMYLNNSVVMYDGVPYYVNCDGMEKENEVSAFKLFPYKKGYDQKYIKFDITSNKLSCDMTLGYMNYGAGAHYLKRKPLRKQKSGISNNCVYGKPAGFNIIRSSHFGEMLMNKYPTVDKAMTMLETFEANTVAVHKNVAMGFVDPDRNILMLYHKGNTVGYRHLGNDHFSMMDSRAASIYVPIINGYKIKGLEV